MKNFFVAMAALLMAVTWYTREAAAVQMGDHRSDVVREMGRPQGMFSKGERTLLFYERGTVELLNDVVVTSQLVSAQAAWEQQQQKIESDKRAAEERRARMETGEAEKQRILSDPSFSNRPPAEQSAVWQDFRRKYPEVAIDSQVAQVQARQQAEQKAKAEVKRAGDEPTPKLSSSKRRKMKRTGEEESAEGGGY